MSAVGEIVHDVADEARDASGRWTSGGGSTPKEPDWNPDSIMAEYNHMLGEEQRGALATYTGVGYERINGHLRGKDTQLAAGDDDNIRAIDQSMVPALGRMRVYRGVHASVFTHDKDPHSGRDFDWSSLVGTEFRDDGFASTSLESEKPRAWAGRRDRGALMEIEVPYASPVAPIYGVTGGIARGTEREVILGRGQTYRITGVEVPDDPNEPALIHVSLIPTWASTETVSFNRANLP